MSKEPEPFSQEEDYALEQDANDAMGSLRQRFHLPRGRDGQPQIYFCGNSLGLQPRGVRAHLDRELSAWAELAVEGHFKADFPWYSYHEPFREPGARLVGARPEEVVMMNGLTANLHLMMASFYRPTAERYKILMEEHAFPSDNYAVHSQLRHHGYDPSEALVLASARPGETTLRTEDIEALLERQGPAIALVLLGGVNYYTGQAFDLRRITAAAHAQGAVAGFDLAHAAGNMPLELHAWNVDFAVWCSYKYLNAGPGAVAGCFVHERHGRDRDLPRFAGWWGNDPATRFRMHEQTEFVPREGADGWQLSNPPILALAPLRASLELFDEAGMPALRAKSERLTGYLEFLVDRLPHDRFELITPREPASRGCQLSIRVKQDPEGLFQRLSEQGIVGDFRAPDVIRVAPVPLYNTFHEVWRFAGTLGSNLEGA